MELNKIYNKDCVEGLKDLGDSCIDCCVTSPPYFGLRDYGTATWDGGDIECNHKQATARNDGGRVNTNGFHGSSKDDSDKGAMNYKNVCGICGAKRIDNQIGLEETPELYVAKMVEVFTEVKRVLKKEGTLWLNLGDSYSTGATAARQPGNKGIGLNGEAQEARDINRIGTPIGCKTKDLIGIPWMVAFALRSSGWYLRQDIIWHKPNPMPESVTDRCTKAHEYIFLMSKSAKYYYDGEAIKSENICDAFDKGYLTDHKFRPHNGAVSGKGIGGYRMGSVENGANKRSVWTVTTKPYSDAHFATFPEDLIVDMIKAGCPEKGTVLDPFMGAGTTALVAAKLNRNFIGFELNPDYLQIAKKRLEKHLGFFNPAYL